MYSSQGSQSRYSELTLVKLSKPSVDFQYVPDKYLAGMLTITNESNFHIAYKFKSIQPQRYLVKTDQNIIEPHKLTTINFTLHPDLIKDKLQSFQDNFQLTVAKLSNNKESLDNIFKRNKNVIETEIVKIPVRIINPANQEVMNNQNPLSRSQNSNFQSPNKNGAMNSSTGPRQNVISVDLKGSQDPNLNTAFLSQKLQEREDQLLNIQREAERYNQNIQTMTSAKAKNSHETPKTPSGKGSTTIKGVAIGLLVGVLFTVMSSVFSSNIEAINPLNL